MEYSEEEGCSFTPQEIQVIDWWNRNSTLEEREEICENLGWNKDLAGGEASLEWLSVEEIQELIKLHK